MPLQLQTFSNFSPGKWEAFKVRLKEEASYEVKENAGTVSYDSCTFDYAYNPTAETLVVQCIKKPLYILASHVVEAISESISELPILPVPPASQTPAPTH